MNWKYFAKNHLWPVLGGLAFGAFTALMQAFQGGMIDMQPEWTDELQVLGSFILGFIATIWNRYGGKYESWTQPKVDEARTVYNR